MRISGSARIPSIFASETLSVSAMSGPSSLWAFAGQWRLERKIAHANGAVDRLAGTCRFSKSGPRLIQEERGWLETADGRFEATRRYIWAEAKGRLDISFEDMRPFHSVPLGAARPETVHLCPPDRYHVTYDFADWPNWRTVWTVEGPRKAYRMESRFVPELASAGADVHNARNL